MSQVKPKKLKISIIAYFVVTNIAFGLLGFGGVAYNYFWQISDLNVEKLGLTVSFRAEAISEWLRTALEAAADSSRQPLAQKALQQYHQGEITRAALIEATRQNITLAGLHNSDLNGLVRLDRDGRQVIQRGQEIPPALWSAYKPGPDQRRSLVKVFNRPDGGSLVLIFSPITTPGGQPLGLDIASLDTEPARQILLFGHDFGLEAQTYLIARDNGQYRLVVSSGPERNQHLPTEINSAVSQARETDERIIKTETWICGLGQVAEVDDWQVLIAADNQKLYQPVLSQIKRTTQSFLIFFSLALVGLWFLALKPLTGEVSKTTGALEDEVEQAAGKLVKEAEGRKKTETKLVVATHRAIVAKQAKSQFLANLSHEIRTPMNAVIGMTDLALFTELTDEQQSYLTEVKKAAAVLLEQINNLLDLSKLEDGLMVTESGDFSLLNLLKQLARSYEPLALDKKLTFTWQLDPQLSDWRRGDQLRVRQAINFLLENAFKFTSSGEVKLLVQPGAQAAGEDDLVSFKIKDSGIGIDPQRLPDIFDPFVQADGSLTRTSGGSGMGLAVTKKLVELMGGSITVESTPNLGSTFQFTISLPPALARRAETPLLADRPSPLTTAEFKGLIAVIADDNEINRTVLQGYLAHWSLTSHTFANGLAALNFLNDNPGLKPDIFIMDVLMPGLTALELAKRLKEKSPSTPLIFLTSVEAGLVEDFHPDDDRKTVTLGKPVPRETLRDCLAHLLARSRPKAAEAKKPAEKLTKTEKPCKILVVDDNQLNRKLAATLLTKRGHSVDQAENGQEALDSISTIKYDMVLMDIQMPVMDGLTAVRHIRADPAKYGLDLPVVAMTAHALPGDQETFVSAGMTGYVSKPFKPQELIAAAEQSGSRPLTTHTDNGGNIVAAELDRAAILENFMDDEELLFESIDLFLERINERMENLKKAVEAKDPDLFMPEAHTLKGMIGIFSTKEAFESAKKLEMKGRSKETTDIEADLKTLENDLAALVVALRAWRTGS